LPCISKDRSDFGVVIGIWPFEKIMYSMVGMDVWIVV